VQVKDPRTGAITTRPRTAADGAVNPDQPAKPGDLEHPQRPARTEGGKIVLAEGVELTEQELRDLVAQKAIADAKKLSAPATPEDFKVELPEGLQLPPGMQFQIDPNHPIIPAARAFALKHGFSQAEFLEMVGLYAATTAGEDHRFQTAKATEVEKLGPAANVRVDAVKTWLQAMGGKDFAPLARALEAAPMAATIQAFERLMQKMSSQGVGGNPGANRDADGLGPNKVDQATYESWSYAQKKEYAENHAAAAGRR
jgi:hypothetical protein